MGPRPQAPQQSAGCDNTLGSNVTRDKCGICGGDNSMCREVKMKFPSDASVSYGRGGGAGFVGRLAPMVAELFLVVTVFGGRSFVGVFGGCFFGEWFLRFVTSSVELTVGEWVYID